MNFVTLGTRQTQQKYKTHIVWKGVYLSCVHHLDINVVLSAFTVSVPLPWASYQIRKFVELRMRQECRGRVLRLHGLAITTCVSESLTGGFLWIRWRKKHPGIPGECANRCFTHLYFLHTLQWRHNRRDSVSNHQPHGLFRRRKKNTSKLRVAGLRWGPVNSSHKWPVTQKMFPFDDVIMTI